MANLNIVFNILKSIYLSKTCFVVIVIVGLLIIIMLSSLLICSKGTLMVAFIFINKGFHIKIFNTKLKFVKNFRDNYHKKMLLVGTSRI